MNSFDNKKYIKHLKFKKKNTSKQLNSKQEKISEKALFMVGRCVISINNI